MNKEKRLQMIKLMAESLTLPVRNNESKWGEYTNDTTDANFIRKCVQIRKELSELIKEVK